MVLLFTGPFLGVQPLGKQLVGQLLQNYQVRVVSGEIDKYPLISGSNLFYALLPQILLVSQLI